MWGSPSIWTWNGSLNKGSTFLICWKHKVFYTFVRADLEGNLFSTVNGVEIVIDVVVWKEVAGLDIGGVCKFDETLDGYKKMQTYREMLLDPTRNLRNRLGVGGLTTEDKMLVFLITYILTSRSSNHCSGNRWWFTDCLWSEIRYQNELGTTDWRHYVEELSLGGLWISLYCTCLKIHWLVQCWCL